MHESDYELSDAHRQVLDERLDAHRSDPTIGKSWEEVKSGFKSFTTVDFSPIDEKQ